MKFPVGRTVLIVAAVGCHTYFTINGIFRRPFPRRSSEKRLRFHRVTMIENLISAFSDLSVLRTETGMI